MTKPTLYLLLGLPGAGKTTTAQTISQLTGAVHLSSDNFRLSLFETPTFTQDEHDALYKMLDYMCELLLKHGTSVVYDANLNRQMHREEKYKVARKVDAKVQLIWLEVPRELAKKRRLATQDKELVPSDETPVKMFERIADIFEPPTKKESFIVLDGTKISPSYVSAQLGLPAKTSQDA